MQSRCSDTEQIQQAGPCVKVSPRQRDQEKSYEICHCCPVGESVVCSTPIRLKPSRQVGSEARVRSREGRCEAGRNKFAGRVIESRNMDGRGQQDNLQNTEGKADAWTQRKAAVPGALRRAT